MKGMKNGGEGRLWWRDGGSDVGGSGKEGGLQRKCETLENARQGGQGLGMSMLW